MDSIWGLLHFLCQSSDLRTPGLVSSSHGLVLVMRMGHRGRLGQRRKQDGKSRELAWGGGGAGQGHCTRGRAVQGGLVPPVTSTEQTHQGCDVGHVCLLPVQPLCRPSSAQRPCRASHRADEAHPHAPGRAAPSCPPGAHIREHRCGNTHHSTPTGAHCRNPKRKGTWPSSEALCEPGPAGGVGWRGREGCLPCDSGSSTVSTLMGSRDPRTTPQLGPADPSQEGWVHAGLEAFHKYLLSNIFTADSLSAKLPVGTRSDKNACYLRPCSSAPRTPVLYSYPPPPPVLALGGGAFGGDQIVRGGLPPLTTRGHSEEIWDENPPDTKPASA